jgi:mannose-6-phosphate isomerase-like protein (cupin superfamily)
MSWTMSARVIRRHELVAVDRGSGIRTVTYADAAMGSTAMMCGRTIFPANSRIAHHTHNREELVVVVRGHATCFVDGRVEHLEAQDASFIPPDVVHRFANEASEELELLWVYGGPDMVRTMVPEHD